MAFRSNTVASILFCYSTLVCLIVSSCEVLCLALTDFTMFGKHFSEISTFTNVRFSGIFELRVFRGFRDFRPQGGQISDFWQNVFLSFQKKTKKQNGDSSKKTSSCFMTENMMEPAQRGPNVSFSYFFVQKGGPNVVFLYKIPNSLFFGGKMAATPHFLEIPESEICQPLASGCTAWEIFDSSL